jgi:3-hydroxyisobutyrate dehydrogenase-like beta-hydroxyacid dehydrogenase
MARVGFVGLGVMGGAMARHLAAAGHETVVWNRSPGKSGPAVAAGAVEADSLADLGSKCSIIFVCVSRTEDVEACLTELTQAAARGTLFVDHSTISPIGAKRIHENLNALGCRFIDAPITGGSMGADKGILTIFCGGSQADFDEALPYMQAFGKTIKLVGGPGAGQMTKMANQIAVAGSLMGCCEALAFAEKAGLDVETTRALISTGAAGSWALDNYGPKVVEKDWSPGFSIINQRKDFGYCQESAEAMDLDLPLTNLTDRLLALLEDQGRGEETTAALFDVYQKRLK